MAEAINWTLNDMSGDGSATPTLSLEIEDARYEVVQFSMTYALNEIPRAACLVAIGRNARSNNAATYATIHTQGINLSQMKKAKVWLQMQGPFDPSSKAEWGSGTAAKRKLIFDGYYLGMAYRKINDKVQPVLHLVHWLVDMCFGSTLSAYQNPNNPLWFVSPATLSAVSTQNAGADQDLAYIGGHVDYSAVANKARTDLWSGLGDLFWAFTLDNKMNLECSGMKAEDEPIPNARAQRALKRFEGDTSDYKSVPYSNGYSKPLRIEGDNVPLLAESISQAIVHEVKQGSFIQQTFWDALIAGFCPMFKTAVVPLVDRALVVPDCPGYRTTWKTVTPSEYDHFEMSGMINKPLLGVGVMGTYQSMTEAGMTSPPDGGLNPSVCVGGSYVVDSVEPGDGTWMVVQSPTWLAMISSCGCYAGASSGVGTGEANNTDCSPTDVKDPTDTTPGKILQPDYNDLMSKYAHSVYVSHMLGGRVATLSGKLRFDISPGSTIRIEPKPDMFSDGQDQLDVPMIGHISRVSWNFNAESRLASTSLQLTHLRTDAENKSDRTSVVDHPLFKPESAFSGASMNATKTPDTVDREWEFS